jgi:hypothetical protein
MCVFEMIDNDRLEKELKSLSGWAKFRTFTILKMPSAAFVGLRFLGADNDSCTTSIPGGWRSQNPFKTMYWAAQGMAAELATGAVPFAISRSCERGLRMFVVGTEATFVKRAKGRIHFTCNDIAAARTAIEAALNSNEATECDMRVVGVDSSGDTVSEWVFKWNFRAR